MTPDEALERVERILELKPRISDDHYREMALSPGKKLGVDVFRRKNCLGHVRVHVWNVIDAEVHPDWAATAPPIELSPQEGCPKCREINRKRANPSLHDQSDTNTRLYYGFEWHVRDEPN